MRLKKRHTSGFTYLEMIVVVAIMTLLAAFLVGGLRTLQGASKLRTSVDRVADTIAFARNRAIADNAIYHVRVVNARFDQQVVYVYRFPNTSDAWNALDETWVQSNGGFSDSSDPETVIKDMRNYKIEERKLEAGCFFETSYDPKVIWQKGNATAFWAANVEKPVNIFTRFPQKTKKVGSKTVFDPSTYDGLFYSGGGAGFSDWNPYPYLAAKGTPAYIPNLVPKVTPDYGNPTYPFPARPQLLFFYPDGTASENILFFIRDDRALQFVQVLKGGLIRTGQIDKLSDFQTKLN